MHDATPFLLQAQRYILTGQNAKAWQAAIVATRIAQARYDERMEVACDHVVETVAQL